MSEYELSQYAIVADIGGTNARFGRINLLTLQLDHVQVYSCAAFTGLEFALTAYQSQYGFTRIKQVAVAIACPVLTDRVCMTNGQWRFSINELQQKLNLSALQVINDFTAVAMSLPVLTQQDLVQIGTGSVDVSKTKVVLGAGTGLGVAYLLPQNKGYVPCSGEGGHADWGAKTEQEWFIYTQLKKNYPHVSYERLLSGMGLENLYQAIARFRNQDVPAVTAAQITEMALGGHCAIAQATVAQFFAILGAYAGDLALTFGAFGGVYLAGGIVPRLLSVITHSDFRACFENKGRFSDFNALIPTYVITAEQPGMLGAAVYLKQSLIGELDVVS